MKALIGTAVIVLLAACSLPQTTVRTGSTQPSFVVKGAPAGSVLYVDGLPMGSAQQFDGNPSVLAVAEGVHVVEVHQGTNVLFHDKVFMSSGESHAITLLPQASR
jgi:hypothetical protein